MEGKGAPNESTNGQESLNPRIVRGIVNYFHMASDAPPESFEPGNPGNPIRFILQDRSVTTHQINDFLRSTAERKYSILSINFFKDLVGPQSPVALDKDTKRENIHQIMLDQTMNNYLEDFKSYGSIDPGRIKTKRESIKSGIQFGLHGKRNVAEDLRKFDKFLELYFGKTALEFSAQYALLEEAAKNKFPDRRPRWESHYNSSYANPGPRPAGSHFGSRRPPRFQEPPPRFERPYPDPEREPQTPPARLDPKGYFAALGINPMEIRELSEDELAEIINQNWRKAVKQHHTDVGGQREAIVRVNVARDFLLDPAKRRTYGK
jgi:hypothetical protein